MKFIFLFFSRFIFAVVLLVLLAGLIQLYMIYGRTAQPMQRTEVKPGIFVTVEEVADADGTDGTVITTEVHWDTPGVSFELRPLERARAGRSVEPGDLDLPGLAGPYQRLRCPR